jgi:PAS domain S-box-containing protein
VPIIIDGEVIGAYGIYQDISEQKWTEDALKISLQRLTQIIDFLPDATFAIDNDGKVIAWNLAVEKMTGVKAEDMLGKGNYEYAIPFYGNRRPVLIDLVGKWNEEVKQKYQYVKKEDEFLFSETYDSLVKPDGFLWNKASRLYDSNGEVIGAIESIRDITESKRTEKALRESEEKYRNILESIEEGYFEVDSAGNFTFFNDSLRKILGYSKHELMGMNNRQYVEKLTKALTGKS